MPTTATAPSPTSFSIEDAAAICVTPYLRPGERMLHGRVYVYDQDALNAYRADEAVTEFMDTGGDAGRLSDDALTTLFYLCLNRQARLPMDRMVRLAMVRVCGERGRRATVQLPSFCGGV
jgi:hypothetical protein